MVFICHFAGIALAQIIHCVEAIPTLQTAGVHGSDAGPRFWGGPLAPREAAQQKLLPAGLGRHVGKLLVLEVQLLGLEDGLHVPELDEVQVKVVGAALIDAVGDEDLLVTQIVEGVDRVATERVHFPKPARVDSLLTKRHTHQHKMFNSENNIFETFWHKLVPIWIEIRNTVAFKLSFL